MSEARENTGAKRGDGLPVGKPFEPGNPGKPKGVRHKLQEDFLRDVQSAWETSGKSAIAEMIAEKPSEFVKMVAGLMPKEATININNADDMSDAELAERIRSLATQLSPFLAGGTGNADEGAQDAAGASIASSVH